MKTTMDALARDRRRARARGRRDRVARGPRRRARGAPAAALERPPDRRARRDRDTPFTDDDRAAARVDRAPRGGRARARPRGDARRARPGDPPPRQEQPPDRRVAAAPAGARRRTSTRARRSSDSVNRILAIAAVHEVLTEQRDDDVDLGELLDRLRAMLVQGLGAGKRRRGDARAGLARRRPRDRARARLHASCSRTRSSTAATTCAIELAQRNGDVVLAIADDGGGHRGRRRTGTGLSIVRALVRDELRGELCARRTHGGPRGAEVGVPGVQVVPKAALRILVAEDETIIRLDLARAARAAGLRGLRRGARRRGGGRARARRAARPRVLDVKMPRLDGIEAARRILDERPIPIVMVTAYGQDELVSRAVEAGVFGYLVKPFREADLLPAIADRARAPRGARRAARGGRLARRGARGAQGDRAGEGPADGSGRASPSRTRSRGCARRARSRAGR